MIISVIILSRDKKPTKKIESQTSAILGERILENSEFSVLASTPLVLYLLVLSSLWGFKYLLVLKRQLRRALLTAMKKLWGRKKMAWARWRRRCRGQKKRLLVRAKRKLQYAKLIWEPDKIRRRRQAPNVYTVVSLSSGVICYVFIFFFRGTSSSVFHMSAIRQFYAGNVFPRLIPKTYQHCWTNDRGCVCATFHRSHTRISHYACKYGAAKVKIEWLRHYSPIFDGIYNSMQL